MITRDKFVQGNFKAKANMDRTAHPVAVFLREHSKWAFSVKEIVKRVKMKEDTVRSMLAKLRQDNLVEHKAPFFAWKIKPLKLKPISHRKKTWAKRRKR